MIKMATDWCPRSSGPSVAIAVGVAVEDPKDPTPQEGPVPVGIVIEEAEAAEGLHLHPIEEEW